MKEKVARALYDALEDEGVEVRLIDDYSGRGMYGDTTFALSGDFGFCDVAVAWACACREDEELKPTDLGFTNDSMGLGIVIY